VQKLQAVVIGHRIHPASEAQERGFLNYPKQETGCKE